MTQRWHVRIRLYYMYISGSVTTQSHGSGTTLLPINVCDATLATCEACFVETHAWIIGRGKEPTAKTHRFFLSFFVSFRNNLIEFHVKSREYTVRGVAQFTIFSVSHNTGVTWHDLLEYSTLSDVYCVCVLSSRPVSQIVFAPFSFRFLYRYNRENLTACVWARVVCMCVCVVGTNWIWISLPRTSFVFAESSVVEKFVQIRYTECAVLIKRLFQSVFSRSGWITRNLEKYTCMYVHHIIDWKAFFNVLILIIVIFFCFEETDQSLNAISILLVVISQNLFLEILNL